MEEGSFSEMPPGPAFLCEFGLLGAAFLPSLQAGMAWHGSEASLPVS